MSSYILGALPFVSLLFMLFGNRDYLMPMFEEQVGHYVLAYGIFSWAIGFLLDAQDDQGEDVDAAARCLSPTMLVAAVRRLRRRDRARCWAPAPCSAASATR